MEEGQQEGKGKGAKEGQGRIKKPRVKVIAAIIAVIGVIVGIAVFSFTGEKSKAPVEPAVNVSGSTDLKVKLVKYPTRTYYPGENLTWTFTIENQANEDYWVDPEIRVIGPPNKLLICDLREIRLIYERENITTNLPFDDDFFFLKGGQKVTIEIVLEIPNSAPAITGEEIKIELPLRVRLESPP